MNHLCRRLAQVLESGLAIGFGEEEEEEGDVFLVSRAGFVVVTYAGARLKLRTPTRHTARTLPARERKCGVLTAYVRKAVGVWHG